MCASNILSDTFEKVFFIIGKCCWFKTTLENSNTVTDLLAFSYKDVQLETVASFSYYLSLK